MKDLRFNNTYYFLLSLLEGKKITLYDVWANTDLKPNKEQIEKWGLGKIDTFSPSIDVEPMSEDEFIAYVNSYCDFVAGRIEGL